MEEVIYKAIGRGDIKKVRRIVDRYLPPPPQKTLILHVAFDKAIAYGKLEVAKLLWEKGGRPNLEKYYSGTSPLHSAVYWYECAAMLEWLFEKTIIPLDVLSIKHPSWTLFEGAIAFGKRDIAQVLWEKGGRSNLHEDVRIVDAMHIAIFYGHASVLKWAIEERVITCRHDIDTLLDTAIMRKRLEIAQVLWKHGARCHELILRTVTNMETLKWIFAENVVPLSTDVIQDLFDHAIAHGRLEIAQFLWGEEKYCVKINPRDFFLWPVRTAISNGCTSMLKWVIEEKVLPQEVLQNIPCRHDTHTLLGIAIAHGRLEIAQFLWKHGARCREYSVKCVTHMKTLKWIFDENVVPLSTDMIQDLFDSAIMYGKLEIAQFLWREKGVKPEECISVHCAAFSGYTSVLKWLFENNIFSINVLKKKISGKTPLDYAIVQSRWETAALLRRLPVDPVFLAMQRAKRDHSSCVLRRLPNELLDMVVDEMAARFHLKVVW